MLKDKDLLQYRRYKTIMEAGYRGLDSNENTITENADDINEDENDMIKRYQL